jgi:hypothetical protein
MGPGSFGQIDTVDPSRFSTLTEPKNALMVLYKGIEIKKTLQFIFYWQRAFEKVMNTVHGQWIQTDQTVGS